MTNQVLSALVREMIAQPNGASVKEVMARTDAKRKTVQCCMQRLREKKTAFVRIGVDRVHIRSNRYFAHEADAAAYVFSIEYIEPLASLKVISRWIYVDLIERNEGITYQEFAELAKVTYRAATSTICRLISLGHIFAARKMDFERRRPVNVLFRTEQRRDEWQAANPLVAIGNTRYRKERIVVARPTRAKKQSRNSIVQTAASKLIAEVLFSKRKKEYAAPPKPPVYVLTDADLQKRTVYAGHPGYDSRYQLPPSKTVSGGFASAGIGSYEVAA
jgi:hypothetical protein